MKLESKPVHWTGKVYKEFGLLEPVTDSLGTRDWLVELGLDLNHPNILPEPDLT
jgi:hypothetical protein